MRVVITVGSGSEKIDPVRFIGARSSGLQGFALAEEFLRRDFEVILIKGRTELLAPVGCKLIFAESADDFLKESLANMPADIFISVAAIADWKYENPHNSKLKIKEDFLDLRFTKNIDVLKIISSCSMRPLITAGFAAESDNLILNARNKKKKKCCDVIFANFLQNSFTSRNSVYVISNEGEFRIPGGEKKDISIKIAEFLLNILMKRKNG